MSQYCSLRVVLGLSYISRQCICRVLSALKLLLTDVLVHVYIAVDRNIDTAQEVLCVYVDTVLVTLLCRSRFSKHSVMTDLQ